MSGLSFFNQLIFYGHLCSFTLPLTLTACQTAVLCPLIPSDFVSLARCFVPVLKGPFVIGTISDAFGLDYVRNSSKSWFSRVQFACSFLEPPQPLS